MPHGLLIVAQAGVALAVLALGLSASWKDASYVLRRPRKLARALLAMNVVVPLFTGAMIALFHLRHPVAVALATLAVAPIPPLLPKRALGAGGGSSYVVGLLAAMSLLAIVFVPLSAHLLGRVASVAAVGRVVAISVLVPLAIGVLAHELRPRLAERAARATSIAGLVLVAIGALPIVVAAMPAAIRLIGDGTLAAVALFNVVGLAAGAFFGGPEREERTVLALTSASRHPGVALVVAAANVSDPKPVVAALVIYLIVNVIACAVYLAASKRPKVAHGAAS